MMIKITKSTIMKLSFAGRLCQHGTSLSKSILQYHRIRNVSQVQMSEIRYNSTLSKLSPISNFICKGESVTSFPYSVLFLKSRTFQNEQRRLLTKFRYRHDENMNAERLLRNSPNYKTMMSHIEEFEDSSKLLNSVVNSGCESISVNDTWRNSVNKFIQAAYASQDELSITHPKNQDVVQTVLQDLKKLSDEELCQILFHVRLFAPCPSSKDPEYVKVWTQLDGECLSRHPVWSLDFCFVVADLWYGLSLARLSEFHWILIKKLFRKCTKLSKEHYVRFMFCLNLNRSIPDNSNSYDMEYSLYKIGNELTANEIVIIAMAFFKTQTKIRDPELLKKLIQITMKDSDNLDSISIAAITKLIRFSCDHKSSQTVWELQKRFIPEVPRLSIAACTHLALSGTNCLTPHVELVQLVVDRIQQSISEARLKELERTAFLITLFNTECDNLCESIASELQRPERADEIRKYGRCLPAILHYLSIKEIFLPDLISMCLSKEFRDTYYGKGKETLQRELLCLDIAADIEISGYSGNSLGEKAFKSIMKRNMFMLKPKSSTVLKNSVYQKFVRAITETLFAVNEEMDFHVCHILPQHPTIAIVYCKNQEGHVKIPEYYEDLEPYQIKKLTPATDLKYYALIPCSRNLVLWNTKELTGQARLQIRQIKKLGYIPQLVHYFEWDTLKDANQQRRYIENILNGPGNTVNNLN